MQRRQPISTPVWPYIAVVTCLFVLCVLAPRMWHASTLVGHGRPWGLDRPQIRFGEGDSANASAVLSRSSGTVAASGSAADRPRTLGEFSAPRRVAPVAPSVARRVGGGSVAGLPSPPESDLPLRIASRPTLGPTVYRPDPMPLLNLPEAATRKLAQRRPAPADRWPYPSGLLRQLEALADQPPCRAWAEAAITCMQGLLRTSSLSAPDVARQVTALESLTAEGNQLASSLDSTGLRADLLRACYAISRRAAVWRHTCRILSEGPATHTVALADSTEVVRWVDTVEQRMAGAEYAEGWRRYLLLDDLRLVASSADADRQRQIARTALMRLESPQLTGRQSDFLSDASFGGLSTALRGWVAEPVDYLRFLEDLELYEETRSTGSAGDLARGYQAIRWAADEDAKQLAAMFNTHYRNANVRVALSAEMLNRLLPTPYSAIEDVRDELLGAEVRGTSHTSARLEVMLVPDPQRWNFALRATGDVDAETASSRGPATFYSESHSTYTAHKSLLVDRQGVRTAPADVGADTEVALQGLETKLDAIPVLNWIVRSVALRQHNRHYDEARSVATARLEEMAGERIDEEVHRQITNVEQEFQQKWLAPLRNLQLKPLALDMQTTSEQLLVRYRLAGDSQLGAHTPRPVPPPDSLLDVQIHETALNNALEQLGLEGKRCELRALYRELADAFQRSDLQVPDDMPEGVTVQFADRNAIRVRCDDDRVSLTIRIAELKNHRRKAWRNFAVRAYYAPDATQIHANLVRDGYIELAGQRLNTMDQVALRGIFTTVLSRNRPFSLVSKQLAQNPRMSDVQVTQFAIHDGWIGVALGAEKKPQPPTQVAGDNDSARR